MSYWFGYRVFDKRIDLQPGWEILKGPYESYDAAKADKLSFRGSDLQKTSISPADSKDEAIKKMEFETWMA